jgi:hypothetical protein
MHRFEGTVNQVLGDGIMALFGTPLSEALLLIGPRGRGEHAGRGPPRSPCTHPGRGYQAYACRLLGEVARRREPPDADHAAGHYRQALAEELGVRSLVAHCHLGLGTLYTRTGQQEQARAELPTAIALYRAMEMHFWLPQAEAALAQTGGAGSVQREADQHC